MSGRRTANDPGALAERPDHQRTLKAEAQSAAQLDAACRHIRSFPAEWFDQLDGATTEAYRAADSSVAREEHADVDACVESPRRAFDFARVESRNRHDVRAREQTVLLVDPDAFDHLSLQAEVCPACKKTQGHSIGGHRRDDGD